nr:hypothetical protein [Streptoalloteichus tenebrarius]BFE98846.1 hypothetical protein GCM10020241_05220 [Streptoalloteichus tenebrarius]
MTSIELRPATPADAELCYQVHHAAMRVYVDAIWAGTTASNAPTTNATSTPPERASSRWTATRPGC